MTCSSDHQWMDPICPGIFFEYLICESKSSPIGFIFWSTSLFTIKQHMLVYQFIWVYYKILWNRCKNRLDLSCLCLGALYGQTNQINPCNLLLSDLKLRNQPFEKNTTAISHSTVMVQVCKVALIGLGLKT